MRDPIKRRELHVFQTCIRERTMNALSLAALPLTALRAAKVDSTVKGVKLGLITGSLNPLPN